MKINFSNFLFLKKKDVLLLLMKTFLIICFLTLSGFTSKSVFSQDTEVIIESNKIVPIEEVFDLLKEQTTHTFIYSVDLFDGMPNVSLKKGKTTVGQLLENSVAKLGYTIEYRKDGTILVFDSGMVLDNDFIKQEQTTISGTVTNEDGMPLPGVNVIIKGTTTGVQTGFEGEYSIEAAKGDVLLFSYLGLETAEYTVGNDNTIDVVLKADETQLKEVVITGYTRYTEDQTPSATTTITSEKINNVPAASFNEILQGRVPGMRVISSSGQPGSSPSVTIRGIGSIDGDRSPLYIMDGIPVEPNYFQTINPNDIESVTVLKDASAKALYGSRGSNGVIIIKTKSGKPGAISFEYSSQYGISELAKPNFIMMDTKERLRFEEEVGLEIGEAIGPGWTYSPLNPEYAEMTPQEQQRADFILDSLSQINTNWRDMFFRSANYVEQQISASGGNEKVTFYNSLNFVDQEGIVKFTGLKRYNLRSNVEYNSGKFSGSINISLGYSQSKFTYNEGGTSVGSPMASVYYALPYEYPYSPEGVLMPADTDEISFLDLREGSRGLDVLFNTSSETEQFKSIIGISLSYDILPNLKAITRAGLDYRNSIDEDYIDPNSYIGSRNSSSTLGGQGAFGEGLRRNFNFISTSGLIYSKNIDTLHDFEISGYFEYLYNNYRAFNYTGYGLDERLPKSPASITVNEDFLPSLGGGRTYSALASFMGIGRYTFDDKYTVTGSYRYDGSSKVPLKNRWQGFYSVGVNWNIKEESFLKDISFIPVLRLRASYGQTASQFGGDFLYLPTYSVSTSYGGTTAIRPSAPGNPDFDWEYVDEFNIGFDLALFEERRISLAFDFYNRITRNMFIDQPLSATAGFSSLPLSTGEMRNRGFELDLNGIILRNQDFAWNVGLNLGYNENTILHVTDKTDELPDGDTRIIKVGLPYGTYYAPQWAGVNPETGEAQYYTREGEITTEYNFDELAVTKSGSLYPKLTGGVTTGIRWKNLSLNALFSFVSDVMRWNNMDFYNENQRYMSSNQTIRMLYDRWKEPGDQAILQRIDIPRNFTSKDIQDASFVRLRNVKLAYSLDEDILNKLGFIKGVNLFIHGRNLYTWTDWRGLDPENNRVYGRFEYPSARTYTLGININF